MFVGVLLLIFVLGLCAFLVRTVAIVASSPLEVHSYDILYNVYRSTRVGCLGKLTFAYEVVVLLRRSTLILLAYWLADERTLALAWMSVVNLCALLVHLLVR